MSQNYQNLDRVGGFDYQLFSPKALGRSQYRGPAADLEKPYIAFVGAAQTFGRFVHTPFPTLLGERMGIGVLNLGVGGKGPRYFDKPQYLDVINGAEAVVIQMLSARSASCSLFDNSSDGGVFGVSPLAPGSLRVGEFFKLAAEKLSESEFALAIEEMQADYVRSFIAFVKKIAAPRILLWLSARKPDYAPQYARIAEGALGVFPQFVNRAMTAEIASYCDAYVECVSSAGLPQPLWRADRRIEGAVLDGEKLVNNYYPSPEMHRQAADVLEVPCRRFTGRSQRPKRPTRRFVIVGAERSGTNLLRDMLNQHEDCFCGGELFNLDVIRKDKVPWLDLDEATTQQAILQRKEDPVGFLNALHDLAHAQGKSVVGFKLMYRQSDANPAVLDALVGDPALRIIRVTRRNQLRRIVSERQALVSAVWAMSPGQKRPRRPKVEIEFRHFATAISHFQNKQHNFETRFAAHDILDIVYEDLAAHPVRVASRALDFLGLAPPAEPLVVNLLKMGADNLSDALANKDVLKAQMRRWVSYFDE